MNTWLNIPIQGTIMLPHQKFAIKFSLAILAFMLSAAALGVAIGSCL